jgi:hypothetical protein
VAEVIGPVLVGVAVGATLRASRLRRTAPDATWPATGL